MFGRDWTQRRRQERAERRRQASATWAAEAEKEENLYGSAEWASIETIRERGLFAGSGVNLGTVDATPIRSAGERHVITIAPSRSGKGTTAIIPTLLDYEGSVLVIDPKGQNAAVTARRRGEMGHQVIVINPFGLHTGEPWNLPKHSFNPLAAIQPGENFVADVSSLCEALIVTEGKDPHWSNAARDLVSAIIMHLKLDTPDKASLPRMRAKLTLPPKEFKELLDDMLASSEPAVRQLAGR